MNRVTEDDQPAIADPGSRATHYWRRIEAEAPHLLGDDRPAALKRMAGNYPNYIAALRHFMDSGEIEPASRLVRALRVYWEGIQQYAEGRAWIAQALSRPEATTRSPARAMMLDHAACLAASAGDFAAARHGWQECLSIRRELGPALLIPVTLSHLGIGLSVGGYGLPAARAALEECIRLCEEQDNQRILAAALHWLARVAIDQGYLTEASALLNRAEALQSANKDWAQWTHGSVMRLRAVIETHTGQPEKAQALFEEGTALMAAHGLPQSELPPHDHAWFQRHLGPAYPIVPDTTESAPDGTPTRA